MSVRKTLAPLKRLPRRARLGSPTGAPTTHTHGLDWANSGSDGPAAADRLKDVAVKDLIALGTPIEEWGPEGDRYEVRYLVKCVCPWALARLAHRGPLTSPPLPLRSLALICFVLFPGRWLGYDDPAE